MTTPVRIAVVGAGLIGYQHILRVRGEAGAALAPISCARSVAPEADPLILELRPFCKVARGEEEPLISGEAMRTLGATLAVKQAAAGGEGIKLA
jgi:hypothetical protein